MTVPPQYHLPFYTAPDQRGEGWCLESDSPGEGRVYANKCDPRKIVIKSYRANNNPSLPVTLELRYAADGSLGWSDTPSEIHYNEEGKPFRKYWYRQGVYWPYSVRRPGWVISSLPEKSGGTGYFSQNGDCVMTLTSQNNVLPKPSPFSNCEVAYFRKNPDGTLVSHRDGDAPAFLIYERLTDPSRCDWDSIWRPVWLEWRKNGLPSREHGPYLMKMGFRQTVTLSYFPDKSKGGYDQLIKTEKGIVMARRFPEIPGKIKGIAYREKDGGPEAIYFTPSSGSEGLLAIHFLPNGKKHFLKNAPSFSED